MSYDGAGSYTPPSPEYPAVAGQLIKSADFNTIVADLATALSMVLVKDGRAPMTGTLQMNVHKITGVVDGTDTQDATTVRQVFTSPAFTGSPTAPTQAPLDNSTKLATTAYTDSAVGVETGRALAAEALLVLATNGTAENLALTGIPTAPTAAPSTDSTQIATTAFVQDVAFNSALPDQTGNGGKFVQTDGTNASWQYVPSSTYTYETAGGF